MAWVGHQEGEKPPHTRDLRVTAVLNTHNTKSALSAFVACLCIDVVQ